MIEQRKIGREFSPRQFIRHFRRNDTVGLTERTPNKRSPVALRISTSLLLLLLGTRIVADQKTNNDQSVKIYPQKKSLVVSPPESILPDYSVLAISHAQLPPASELLASPPTQNNLEVSHQAADVEQIKGPITIETAPNSTIEFGEQLSLETNAEGLPIRVTFYNKTQELDPGSMANIREKAIQTGVPQMIFADRYEVPKTYPSSTEHRTYDQLPPEFINDSEVLKRHGVTIIQGEYAQLAISEHAFQPGGPLEYFSNNGRKLTIVIVDGPMVFTGFMDDPKYDSVRNLLVNSDKDVLLTDQEYATYLVEHAQRIEKRIEVVKQLISDQPNNEDLRNSDQSDRDALLVEYIQLQANLYRIAQGLVTKDEVLGSYDFGSAVGTYIADMKYNGNPTVFIAAGATTQADVYDGALYYDATGQIQFFNTHQTEGQYRDRLSSADSHPDPSKLQRDQFANPDDPYSHPYLASSLGQILRHELAHDRLVYQGWSPTGYDDSGEVEGWRRTRDWSVDWPKFDPNWSEYDTDMWTIGYLRDAWDRWINSGYSDGSGYFFAFSVKEVGTNLTKYILTMNKPVADAPNM